VSNRRVVRHSTGYRRALLKLAIEHDWRSVVEIGVRLAGTGVWLMHHKPNLSYIGIDPFVVPAASTEEGFTDYGRPDMQSWFEEAQDNLKPFGDRASLWRLRSTVAAKRLVLKPDAVFIDGDHRETEVLADIDAWSPKLRAGGWMTGHDWDWPSVQKAVLARFPEPRLLAFNVWAVQV
jgi:hypothetical protein